MPYTRAHYDLGAPKNPSDFAAKLGLRNLGLSICAFGRGEGYDFFHNHREQEEVYFCLAGQADLIICNDAGKLAQTERLTLERGDLIRVEPHTLRAIGNLSSEQALVLIAGACPHPYPAGFGHHDVIADVLAVVGHAQTGFRWPAGLAKNPPPNSGEDY